MYEFIDTTEKQIIESMPSEALKINGEWIENLIDGYRTLYVTGREMLSPNLEFYETGIRDGAFLQSRNYPERIITIGYQLITHSNAEFRVAYSKLAEILDTEDAELIFNDELDKFYIGTPSEIGEIEGGRHSLTGEFEIVCADPFKYSVEEYEVIPTSSEGAFVIDYNGTYKSYPVLEADFYKEDDSTALTGTGECGFVAFFNDREKIIQLGDPEEVEGVEHPKSQVLTAQDFLKSTAWDSGAKDRWKTNVGITTSTVVVQTGSMKLAHSYNTTVEGSYFLTPSSYGTGEKWHGPSITRTLPADASGEVGAVNFTLTYKQKMAIGNGKNDTKQYGAFQVLLVSGSGDSRRIVAGANVFKGKVGKTAKLRFYIDHKTVETIDIDLSYHNKYFGHNRAANPKKKIKELKSVRTSKITKSGKTVEFNIGGIVRQYTSDAIANTKVTQVVFTMTKWGTKPELKYNGLYWAKLVKDNCATWEDIPNKFSANDVIIADCATGDITLNDSPAPELGALGNDWEDFYLEKGTNQIGVAYSDWTSNPPACRLRYREVYL